MISAKMKKNCEFKMSTCRGRDYSDNYYLYLCSIRNSIPYEEEEDEDIESVLSRNVSLY